MILIPILLPLCTALLIQILGRLASDNVRDGAHTLMAIINFYFVLQILPDVMSGARPEFLVAEMIPGAPIYFQVEPLGMLFALVCYCDPSPGPLLLIALLFSWALMALCPVPRLVGFGVVTCPAPGHAPLGLWAFVHLPSAL